MAFSTDDKEKLAMAEQLDKQAKQEAKKKQKNKDATLVAIPTKNKAEKAKNYTLTFKPSVREHLDVLAKEHNYRSISAFLTDFIESSYNATH